MLRSLKNILDKFQSLYKYIALIILRSPVDTVLCIINALFLQYAFEVMESGGFSDLFSICLFFLIANLGIFFYNGTVWSIYAAFSANLAGKIHKLVFNSILRLPYQKMEEKLSGEWMVRTNGDVKMTLSLLNDPLNLTHFILGSVRLLVSALLLIRISVIFFLMDLTLLLPNALFRRKYVVSPMGKLTLRSQNLVEENLKFASAIMECSDTVYLYDAGELLIKRYEQSSLEIVKVRMQMSKRNAICEMIYPIFAKGGFLLLLFVGCFMIRQGQLEFGKLSAALQYRGSVLWATNMLLNCCVQIKKNSVGLKRMEEVYGEQE